MKLASIGLQACLLFGLTAMHAHAQQKDSLVFLGDTLQLSVSQVKQWEAKGREPMLKAIPQTTNSFLVQELGKLSFKDQQFEIADPLDDGVMKILVIGNSFSDDGVEYYFHDLAKQAGHALVIGNLFRGGAPLDFHLKNAKEDIKIYDYRKTSIDGAKSNTRKTSIKMAIDDENWDIICFQQASVLSGDLESVRRDLPQLFDYVKENYPIPTVKYAFHQTWAYAQNATTKNFERYQNNQEQMFQQIVEVSKEINKLIPISYLIPSGTAIQNGRTSSVGDNFNREGYHLDLRIGRFTAASSWYETIFGNLANNAYKPFNLTRNQAAMAKEAAILAVKQPFQISDLSNWKMDNTPVSFSSIQVNFAADLVMPGWNSFLFERQQTMLSGLVDKENKPTSVYVNLTHNFDARSAKGPQRTASPFKMPKEVSESYFFSKLTAQDSPKEYIEIGNLDPKKNYTLTLFSGFEVAGKPFLITVNGHKKAKAQEIDPSYNKTQSLCFEQLRPNAAGKLFIAFQNKTEKQQAIAVINALCIAESLNH